jgi:uncharacterized protein (DUF433 family)
MDRNDLITIDPDILGGTPVFKGARVPIKTLFEHHSYLSATSGSTFVALRPGM